MVFPRSRFGFVQWPFSLEKLLPIFSLRPACHCGPLKRIETQVNIEENNKGKWLHGVAPLKSITYFRSVHSQQSLGRPLGHRDVFGE